MDKKLLDLYSDYLLSSFGATTATGLSSLLDGQISHDQVTRFLSQAEYTSKELWHQVKSVVRTIEREDGCSFSMTRFSKSRTRMKMS